uniref:Uncharacterized protein n=1 Tax=Ciona savignyi TaxID=51511 RepID=H2Y7G0_CIOSA
ADWSPTIGHCIKVRCPALSSPQNGEMSCTDDNKFQSTCAFTCSRGYERIGASSSTCQSNRTFTQEPPMCREILCPVEYISVTDGVVICSDANRFDSMCEYNCNDGFQLTRDSVSRTRCQINYNWEALFKPVCERKLCSQGDPIIIRALQHGSIQCTNDMKFESQCTLSCNVGYEITGDGSTVCLADQSWSENFGECIKVQCSVLADPDNGGMRCTEANKYQSICTFSCNAGYELIGHSTSECQHDRQFSNSAPFCQKTRCPVSHLETANANTTCTEENLFESTCEYQCIPGYEVTGGVTTVTCMDDQSWSAEKAICEKKICSSTDENIVKADKNGNLTCTDGHIFDSVCSLECDVGYELVEGGSSQTRCSEDATWQAPIGYCIKIECPMLDEPVNGNISCSENNKYLSECEFQCSLGYEIVGEAITMCQAGRTWSYAVPTCQRVSCPTNHLTLTHGSVSCSIGNKFESVCAYQCDRGYEMGKRDFNQSTCTELMLWTNQKPTCMKKKCAMDSPDIVKANLIGTVTCTEENLYQSVCSVDCPSGYELTGGHQDITCSHTAQWSESMGHCQRIRCGVLDQPTNSTMVCSDEDKFESVCHFTCTPGYYRDGPSSTTCQADRTYSNELPTCQKISCPDDHNNIQFGSVNCTEGNLFQSVCSYQCDADYQIFGDSFATNSIVTSECQDFGEWTEVVPICERKTCSHDDEDFIAAMESGSVECSDGNRAGTVCMITCNEGYQVVGMTVITCTSSGSWNDSIGYCENIECPHLNPPESGDISCTSENNFASVCTYTCDDGYQFVGDVDVNEKVTQCLSDRTWTVETLPQCEKKHCPLWSAPDHGSINCTDSNLYMSQCLYMCEDGYRLSHPTDSSNQHSEIVSCGSNAEWSVAEAPKCTRITCSPNATTLQQTELHGSITCSNNAFYESVCTVKCNKGYELSGENNVTSCSSSLEWTPQLSACEKIQCNALVAPANGRISCSEGSQYKSHCKLMCDLGYSILDPENDYDVNKGIECRADGSWCGEVPTCEKIQCSAAHLSIAYGTVHCSDDNIFQSTCVYHCNTGYHMIQGQPDRAECTHNTRWTNPVPTCENNRCPANDTSISEALLFGDVTCTDENKFGSRCLLKCYEGYEMSGEPGTNCLESGRWSNGLGLCSKIECEPIEAPSNTSLQCTDEFKFQSLCVFECIAGYTRSDEASYDMSCQADGNWMGSVPTCEKITCPIDQVVTIEHGQVTCDDQNRFESQCVFVCDPGYTMLHHNSEYDVTTHVLSCLANGSWDFENYPECVPVGCPDVGVVNGRLDCSGGFTYGSQCMLSCDSGYEATSPSINIQCDSSGEWWPQLAACQKISCSDPTTPHTSISCTDGFNYGSICSFSSCEVGYEASTSVDDVTSCMADGQWLGLAPQCTKKTCPASFIDVNNGRVVCNDTNNFQSECEFICDTGYELNQVNNIARCGQTNTWNIAPLLCIRRQSCDSTYVPFGNVHCGSDGRCRLNCQPTSTLLGVAESICTDVNGTVSWTPALGSCLRRSCAAITSIRNGNVECTNNFKFRSVCRFRCENGYQLSGPVAARCNANLQWSSETPVCQAVTCNATYTDIAFGSAIQSNSNLQGSVIRYTCTEDGYVLVGDHQITCRSDGRWSAEKPKCQRQQCPPLHIANGGVQCTREIHNEWGSQCSFFCNEFHQLDGNHSTTVCGRDGQWSNPTPFCRGHCDIDFPNFENGSVTCTNSNYHHSQCSFSCDSDENGTPLNMHGSRLLTCQSSGRWSATPPCCTDACPSRTKVDLYIVIESRSSVESGNWNTLLNFINLLIQQFSVNDETTLVGLLRYHREVDVIGEVPLGRHRNLESLSRAIKFMPYGGYGANIGRALQHVSSRSLESAGNRLDVRDHVILFTDGRSQDNVTTAAQLLKEHATVQVVGMQSNRMNRKQLETIASKPNYVHSVPNISALDQSVVEAITMNMCENPCLLSQNYITRMRSYITV